MEKRSFETAAIVEMHLVRWWSSDGSCFAVAAFVLMRGGGGLPTAHTFCPPTNIIKAWFSYRNEAKHASFSFLFFLFPSRTQHNLFPPQILRGLLATSLSLARSLELATCPLHKTSSPPPVPRRNASESKSESKQQREQQQTLKTLKTPSTLSAKSILLPERYLTTG